MKMAVNFLTSFFKYPVLNESIYISIKISPKFVPKVRINYLSTGSDNGLAPLRRAAIIWPNDG